MLKSSLQVAKKPMKKAVQLLQFSLLSVTAIFASACSSTDEDPPQQVFEGESIDIYVQPHPLADGALQIKARDEAPFWEWEKSEALEAHGLMQRILAKWEREFGITSYILVAELRPEQESSSWQLVPVPDSGGRFWKQFWMLLHATFPPASPDPQTSDDIAQLNRAGLEKTEPLAQELQDGSDVFGNEEIVTRQEIFGGESVILLQDYRPLSLNEDRIHLQIIPKAPKLRQSDLSEKEWTEVFFLASRISEILFAREENRPNAIFLLAKVGPEAGQGVARWSMHLVAVGSQGQGYLAQGRMLLHMLAIPFPFLQFGGTLTDAEIAQYISDRRLEFSALIP